LGRGLVVVRGPGLAAVEGDLGAAVVGDDHSAGLLRIDPQVVVVAVWRADGLEGLTAIARAPELHVGHVDLFLVLRAGEDAREVPRTRAEVGVAVAPGPGLAAVVAAENAAVLGLDQGPDALRINRRDGHADDADRPLRQALVARDLLPRVAAVGALPQ